MFSTPIKLALTSLALVLTLPLSARAGDEETTKVVGTPLHINGAYNNETVWHVLSPPGTNKYGRNGPNVVMDAYVDCRGSTPVEVSYSREREDYTVRRDPNGSITAYNAWFLLTNPSNKISKPGQKAEEFFGKGVGKVDINYFSTGKKFLIAT